MKTTALCLLATALTLSANASDHIDGPITSKHAAADITDLYAFPAPDKAGYMTLILNSHPMVSSDGHFEDRLRYILRMKEAVVSNDGIKAVGGDRIIVCNVTNPHLKTNKVTCLDDDGATLITGKVNTITVNNKYKIFAGRRSDPFFFNSDWATAVSTKGKLPAAKNSNIMDMINTLSLVIEFNPKELFPKAEHLAVVAEIQTVENNAYKQLDRVGRPEITNVSLVAHQGDKDLRDFYNREDSFYVNEKNKASYKAHLEKNITYYDKLDKSIDWSEREKSKLTDMFMNDFLVVSTTESCDKKQSYLSIEQAIMSGKVAENACGGRHPNDDIMDTMFSLYINSGKKRIRDGADKPYRTVSKKFPYLAQPDDSIAARAKAWIARKILK